MDGHQGMLNMIMGTTSKRDDDDITVAISNCSTPVETSNKATNPIQISKDLGISDA